MNAPDSGTGGAGDSGTSGDSGVPPAPGKFVGNITTNGAVRDGFVDVLGPDHARERRQVGLRRALAGSFNWTALDKIYKYAKDQQHPVQAAQLRVGRQQPSWVNSGNAEPRSRSG